jgi:uncharacterized protein
MKIFLDTSSLFKLYHNEEGTKEIMDFFKSHKIEAIYIAEITKIEFSSVVWKKCRKNEINEDTAQTLVDKFNIDSKKFIIVEDNQELKRTAKYLIGKHWKKGLRTLDSIQLASALSVKLSINFMFTSDILLSDIAILEGVKIG